MDSTNRFAQLVAVIRRCGTVHSRLKLHKMFYVLRSLGYPVPWGYEFRDHGPYSAALAADLQSAVNAGYVDEEQVDRSTEEEGEADERYRRYDLTATEAGAAHVDALASESPMARDLLESLTEVAGDLAQRPPVQLELWATLMFLQDQRVRADIIQVLLGVKPHFTQEEAARALGSIASLRAERAYRPARHLSEIIGIVTEGPPTDAAADLDEEIYGAE